MPGNSRPVVALRLTAVGIAVTVLIAGCSPDLIEAEVEPDRAQTCDDLIPTGEALAVQLLAAVETVPIDVLTGDVPPEGPLAELLDKGRQYDERTVSLGCDPKVLNAAIMERVGDQLEPGSLAGVILRDIMLAGAGSGATPTETTVAPSGSD